MNRPGPTGMSLLVAFSIVVVIEFKTLLEMIDIEIAAQVYYPLMAALLGGVLLALWLVPDDEGNPNRASH